MYHTKSSKVHRRLLSENSPESVLRPVSDCTGHLCACVIPDTRLWYKTYTPVSSAVPSPSSRSLCVPCWLGPVKADEGVALNTETFHSNHQSRATPLAPSTHRDQPQPSRVSIASRARCNSAAPPLTVLPVVISLTLNPNERTNFFRIVNCRKSPPVWWVPLPPRAGGWPSPGYPPRAGPPGRGGRE